MVRACLFIFFSLSLLEGGRTQLLSVCVSEAKTLSLPRRRRRRSSPLALAVALTMSSTPLLNCCSLFTHRVIQSSVSRYSFSLTSPDCRRFTRPFATKHRETLQNACAYRQCHSISHGRCSNFFAGTTLTFCTSRFVLFRMSNASSPTLGPFLFPLFVVSSCISSAFDDGDGPA